jgi:branched-chain amino acid transport system substrate-binding protein
VIKVGALYPITGPDAGWAGDPYIKSHQMAIDEINEAGGIACLNGAKLEMVKGDTQSKAEVGNSEMERLITKEGVVAVFGSALSQTTVPATEISEKYQVPYIVPNALDGNITNRGLKYVFQTVSLLQDWGAYDVKWAKDQGAKTAVIAVPNISFGAEVADTWEKAVEAEGLELLENFTFEANTNDFTDTILRVKQADPDVWFIVGNADTPQFVKQLKEQGYYPKMGIVTLGSGFATSFFLNEVTPALADGIIFTMDFAPVSKLPVPEDFKAAFKEYTGQDLGGTYNTTYASTWLLADALEKACSTDPKVIAETLRTTKFEEGKWGFQWPSASFNEMGRLNEAATVIGQWQDGQMVAVWPDELAANKAVWPVPGWDARGEGPIATAPPTAEATQDPALASEYSQALLKDAKRPSTPPCTRKMALTPSPSRSKTPPMAGATPTM